MRRTEKRGEVSLTERIAIKVKRVGRAGTYHFTDIGGGESDMEMLCMLAAN